MSTRLYLKEYEVAKVYQQKSGFDRNYDFRFRLTGIAGFGYQDIVLNVAWTESKTLVPNTNRVQLKLTSASVIVYKSGTGWIALEELPEGHSSSVKFSDRIITFVKKFNIIVPVSAVLKEIPIIKELDTTKTREVEIHGYLDVVSMLHGAEFIW